MMVQRWWYSCLWLAALVLLDALRSAVGFLPSTSSNVCNINNANKKLWRVTTTYTSSSSDDFNNDIGSSEKYNEKFSTIEFNDADSTTRRRLLLSLLASTSLAPFAANADDTSSTVSNTASSLLADNSESTKPIKIIKPPLDKRTYNTYTLPNGLKVLLCSDPDSTTSAVAMNVHVGACSDPVEIPGLAHFCEHMLFLGTKMYPEEDSFSKFLSANGK